MNSVSEINELVESLEKRFPVSSWTVGGTHVWPLIRLDLSSRSMWTLLSPKAPKNEGPNRLLIRASQIWQMLVFAFKTYFRNRKTLQTFSTGGEPKVLFFDDGLSYAAFPERDLFTSFEALRLMFDRKKIKSLVVSFGYKYSLKTNSPVFLLQPSIDWSRIRRRLSVFFKKSSPEVELDGYEDLVFFLKDKGLSPLSQKELIARTQTMKDLAAAYGQVLTQIQPQAVFINCYYTYQAMSFVEACRIHSIPTFDVQHGVAGSVHRAYRSWLAVPKDGYSLLPDYFLSWSAADADAVNSWSKALNRHKAFFTGNLFLELFKSPNILNCDLAKDFFIDIHRFKVETKRNILIALNWGMDLEQPFEELWKFCAQYQTHYSFYVRLHPLMKDQITYLKDIFSRFGFSQYNLTMATAAPLAALLPQMDLHITYASATAFEAASFGKKTILLSDYGVQCLAPNLPKEMWILAKTAEEIGLATEASLAIQDPAKLEEKNLRMDNLNQVLRIVGQDSQLSQSL